MTQSPIKPRVSSDRILAALEKLRPKPATDNDVKQIKSFMGKQEPSFDFGEPQEPQPVTPKPIAEKPQEIVSGTHTIEDHKEELIFVQESDFTFEIVAECQLKRWRYNEPNEPKEDITSLHDIGVVKFQIEGHPILEESFEKLQPGVQQIIEEMVHKHFKKELRNYEY